MGKSKFLQYLVRTIPTVKESSDRFAMLVAATQEYVKNIVQNLYEYVIFLKKVSLYEKDIATVLIKHFGHDGFGNTSWKIYEPPSHWFEGVEIGNKGENK